MLLQNLKKIHIGLIKFIHIEIPKNKSIRKKIVFLISAGKAYCQAIYQWYKIVLQQSDPEYQKQKKQYEKYQQYRKDIGTAWKIIMWMIKQGETRNDRKWIRRDFEKFGRISKETEKMILKELYNVDK
jgi:hypothetical protein